MTTSSSASSASSAFRSNPTWDATNKSSRTATTAPSSSSSTTTSPPTTFDRMYGQYDTTSSLVKSYSVAINSNALQKVVNNFYAGQIDSTAWVAVNNTRVLVSTRENPGDKDVCKFVEKNYNGRVTVPLTSLRWNDNVVILTVGEAVPIASGTPYVIVYVKREGNCVEAEETVRLQDVRLQDGEWSMEAKECATSSYSQCKKLVDMNVVGYLNAYQVRK